MSQSAVDAGSQVLHQSQSFCIDGAQYRLAEPHSHRPFSVFQATEVQFQLVQQSDPQTQCQMWSLPDNEPHRPSNQHNTNLQIHPPKLVEGKLATAAHSPWNTQAEITDDDSRLNALPERGQQ